MTWAEFKTAVRVLLTVDADRLGTEAFIEQHTRAAVQDLLHFIPFYRRDYVRTFLPSDFATEQHASRGAMPDGARLTQVDILRATPSEGCFSTSADGQTGARLLDDTDYGDLTASSFTFETWAKPFTLFGLNRYLINWLGDNQGMFTFGFDNAVNTSEAGARLKLVLYLTTGAVTLTSTTVLTKNEWAHYACTWDRLAGVASIWINGVLDCSVTTTAASMLPVTNGYITHNLYRGKLDERKLWNTAKGADHFARRFDAGAVEDGLVFYFKYNTGVGYTAEERGVNGAAEADQTLATTFEEVTETEVALSTGILGFQYFWDTDHFPVNSDTQSDVDRRPCPNIAWQKRFLLINNEVELLDQNGRVAIAPNGRQFLIYPLIQEEDAEEKQMTVEVRYDTDTVDFLETDEVPFDEQMVDCVADRVKGELARHVDRDLAQYASFLAKPGNGSRLGGTYYQKRTQLYLRAKERGRVNDDE